MILGHLLTDTLVPRSESGKVEQLPKLVHSILWVLHRVADRPWVLKDLIVIAALVGLVAEEVDGAVLDAADLLLGFDVLQAVGLVPASGEDVEGDLAADGVAAWEILLAGTDFFQRASWTTAITREGFQEHT